MHPVIIDMGTDADAGFWLAALPFVNFPVSEYPAHSGPSIPARETGRRHGEPAPFVSPVSAAPSVPVHEARISTGEQHDRP